ncbi:hypothetical protein C8J57DRAFT_1275906 [Mycena rebaudengoi]|nr:hypothetical protein C8J57DRAFT_1275906 [Mycena rebaudengoi]
MDAPPMPTPDARAGTLHPPTARKPALHPTRTQNGPREHPPGHAAHLPQHGQHGRERRRARHPGAHVRRRGVPRAQKPRRVRREARRVQQRRERGVVRHAIVLSSTSTFSSISTFASVCTSTSVYRSRIHRPPTRRPGAHRHRARGARHEQPAGDRLRVRTVRAQCRRVRPRPHRRIHLHSTLYGRRQEPHERPQGPQQRLVALSIARTVRPRKPPLECRKTPQRAQRARGGAVRRERARVERPREQLGVPVPSIRRSSIPARRRCVPPVLYPIYGIPVLCPM